MQRLQKFPGVVAPKMAPLRSEEKGKRTLLCLAVLLFVATGYTGACADPPSSVPPLSSHFARYGTNRVHYLIGGNGVQTVLFVHGWGGNTDFWRDPVAALIDKAKVVLVDLPGHGKSDKPKVDYTMDFFAGGVLAVLKDARVDKATLVGHSMGVPVICRAYAKATNRVVAIVAVDGLLRRPKGTPDQFEAFTAPYRTPEYREHTRKFIATMFPNPGTEALRDWTLSQVLATPQYVLSSAMDGMFEPGQPDWDLGKVSIPVLVINAKSAMWTPEYEKYVHSLSPQTEYRTIEGAGHFLMGEKPKEFSEALVSMLEKFKLIR
ncbi:MAG TPA: alpha/beta hydrolase [Verrucomicrobiae bacterium]